MEKGADSLSNVAVGSNKLAKYQVFVLLDSNIYCGDWFLRGAPFRYLCHFLNNEGHTLLVPRVVLEEVANVRLRKFSEEAVVAGRAIAALNRLNGNDITTASTLPAAKKYELLSLLKESIEGVVVLEYNTLPHDEIFQRALKVQRPFREGEKGYRDTLIWMSLLAFLKTQNRPEQVAFITTNKNDFFTQSEDAEFHPDLRADLTGANVVPFKSLAAFVDRHVDKDLHGIDRVMLRPEIESFLEDQTSEMLLGSEPQKLLWRNLAPGMRWPDDVRGSAVEIMEGVEDLEFRGIEALDDDIVYVACRYDLRIVIVTFIITRAFFEANHQALKEESKFWETDVDNQVVTLKSSGRVYVTASFTYDKRTALFSGFSYSDVAFRT
ncbi:MAG: PIN domain-containing protein [Solirubrobacteraceae bacterium]|nr:PIN domain-containing protein [Solirubrobacteraceae bacterium]